MKKKLILLYCFCIVSLSNTVIGQNWVPLDKGLPTADIRSIIADSNFLYVAGAIYYDGNGTKMRGIAKWDGIKWDSVGNANKLISAVKTGLYKYHDTLITSGIFYDFPFCSLAKLNGDVWKPYPNSRNVFAYSFQEKDSLLFFGGTFDTCGNDPTFSLGKFDGVSFIGLTPLYKIASATIMCIAFFMDTLYVGGCYYLSPVLPIAGLSKWNGTDLVQIAPEFNNSMCMVNDMIIYNNELYIGGAFTKASGFSGDNIMKWDGHHFTEVGNGTNWPVTSMLIYNDELYVFGQFTEVDGSPCNNLAKWNGSTWTCLNHDDFDEIGQKKICIYKDELYIAGYFRTIGGDTMNSIAKYNHPLIGIKENNKKGDGINIYPNPATDKLTTEFTHSSKETIISIYNIQGQLILQKTMQQPKTEIDIRYFAKGIYFVKINNADGIIIKKLIKE